jgi:epoxyqueuosine reductase
MTGDLGGSAPPLDPLAAREFVGREAKAIGFAAVGVCDASPIDRRRELEAWLAAGRHGEMAWLADRSELLLDPSTVLEGARSAIVVADRYHDGRPDRSEASAPPRGRVARYARGEDYHRTIRRRLERLVAAISPAFPQAEFRICVDTAPLLERELAARAGLARIGKHTLAISPGLGSWTLLGEVLTTASIAPTSTGAGGDPCGGCTRCIDACPTTAISPFSVEATRCVSYLTIEHRGAIDPALHEGIGDWVFGCDVCQEVCPHNQPTRRSRRSPGDPALAARRDGFSLLELLSWTEEDRRAAFVTSAMKRAKLPAMRRNAVIAAANAIVAGAHGSMELQAMVDRVREIAADPAEDPLVRRTAIDSIRRIDARRS